MIYKFEDNPIRERNKEKGTNIAKKRRRKVKKTIWMKDEAK